VTQEQVEALGLWQALAIGCGLFAVLDGVTAVVAGLRHRRNEAPWTWHLVLGAVLVLAGILAFAGAGPAQRGLLLLTLLLWSIVAGIAEIRQARAMRKQRLSTWGWIRADGVLRVLLVPIGMVVGPLISSTGLNSSWILVFIVAASGATLICWAFQLRRTVSADLERLPVATAVGGSATHRR
jgi:uncharacterized membrane protein HdeD (DUF308 family)